MTPHRLRRRLIDLAIGIAFAAALGLIAAYRIDSPGLYYDELHQAPAAFAWVGKPAPMFSIAPMAGIPTMNMPYSGAIKSALYGGYLRATGNPFTARSWRGLGVGLAVLGVLLFYAMIGDRIPIWSRILLGLFLVTDSNLALQAAHDWGPVSLAFLLRMLLLALWIRSAFGTGMPRQWVWMGLIVGLSIFEKLSSAVLLAPLAVFLLTSRAVDMRRVAGAAAGVFIGALPVIIVNIHVFVTQSILLATLNHSTDASSLRDYASSFTQVGVGALQRQFIFGLPTPTWIGTFETIGLVALCGAVGWTARRAGDGNLLPRSAAVALAAYLGVAVFLRLLPAATAENHWIIGTPFQYLAIALALPAIWAGRDRWIGVAVGATGLVLMGAARFAAADATRTALRGDHFQPGWDPSVTVGTGLLASLPAGSRVVAADWGIATQVFSLSNGRQSFVYEPFWDADPTATVKAITGDPAVSVIAVAALRPRPDVKPGAADRIYGYMRDMPGWREVPFGTAGTTLRALEIHQFERLR